MMLGGDNDVSRAAFAKHYEHGLAVFAKTVEVKTLANPNTDSFGVKLAYAHAEFQRARARLVAAGGRIKAALRGGAKP